MYILEQLRGKMQERILMICMLGEHIRPMFLVSI